MAMAYLLDANIFIQSRKQLPMDVWVSFWNRFAELVQSGNLMSSDKVKEEIENDEIFDWLKEKIPSGFFVPEDVATLNYYRDLQNWAANQNFTDAAKIEFATVADAFVIAMAKAKNMTVVTFEKSNPVSKKKVKIPDACAAVGVRCCDLNTALRELGITI